MARKKMLSEGEIRQFMKLAKMRPIGEKRLHELGAYPSMPGARDDEEAGLPEPGADIEVEERPEPPVEDMPEPELGAEEEDPGEKEAAVSLLQHIQDWAEDRGIEMEVEDTEVEGEEFEDGPPEDFEGPDLGEPEEEFEIEEEEPAEPALEESVFGQQPGYTKPRKPARIGGRGDSDEGVCTDRGGTWDGKKCTGKDGTILFPKEGGLGGGIDEQAVVAEVAKRVAARLQREHKKEQMADQLAERIMKRLTK
tara:strand:- start:517 stop:1272 length:756 start_codon:yes stop_codon:yes gene_type:complete